MAPACFPEAGVTLGDTVDQRDLAIAIYIVCCLTSIACFAVFLYGKYTLRLSRLRRRHTILVLCIFIGCMLQFQLDTLETIITSAQYPCTLRIFLTVLVVPFIAGGIAGRLVTFYFRSRYEQLVMEARSKPGNHHLPQVHRDKSVAAVSSRNAVSDLASMEDSEVPEYEDRLIGRSAAVRALLLGAKELFFHHTSNGLDLAALRYLQSGDVTLIFFIVVFVLPALVFALALTLAHWNQNIVHCVGCVRTLEVALFVSLQALATFFFIAGGLRRSWFYPDVFGILSETMVALVCCIVTLIGFILSAALPSTPDGIWDYSIITDLGVVGVLLAQTVLQVFLGYRTDRKAVVGNDLQKRKSTAMKIEDIADEYFDNLKLDQVLHDLELSKLFEDHLAKEFAVESLYFLRDAQKWTQEYSQMSTNTRNTRARKLVNLYIRPTGVLAINLPHSLSKPVLDEVEQEQGNVNVDLFSRSMREIELLLERGAIPRFSQKLAKIHAQTPLEVFSYSNNKI